MAQPQDFALSSYEHKERFQQNILNNTDIVNPNATPQEHPKAVVLAGQPGAGKGDLTLEVKEEFHNNIVTIDPDELRKQYPNVESL